MKKRVKRTFSKEFRAEVVKLVLDGGKPSSQVARDHNLGPSLVATWVRQARVDASMGPAHALSTAERDELTLASREVV